MLPIRRKGVSESAKSTPSMVLFPSLALIKQTVSNFNSAGHLIGFTDPAGAVTYTYDASGRLIKTSRPNSAVETYFTAASVTGDSRPVLVWAPETSLGTKLVLFLSKEVGVRAILTKDPLRAATNLQKHRPHAGNASLVLLKDAFLRTQEEYITKEVAGLAFHRGRVVTSLQEVPAEDNTVVIVAENNPHRPLPSGGDAGKPWRVRFPFRQNQTC